MSATLAPAFDEVDDLIGFINDARADGFDVEAVALPSGMYDRLVKIIDERTGNECKRVLRSVGGVLLERATVH